MEGSSEKVKRDLFWLAKLPDAHGNSVYDRLAEVLLVILKEKPENPIEKFEALLGRVKDAEMDAAYTKKKPITFRGIPELEQASEGCSLFKPVELSVNKNGQQTTVVDPIDCKIPDLAAECRMLEWAGVAVRPEEQYRLHLALRRLAHHDRSLKTLRFWGKILGTHGNYWVAEGTLKDAMVKAHLPVLPAGKLRDAARRNVQKAERFNEFKYFVCAFPGAAWIPLPHVTYEQLVAQPTVSKHLTGSLEAAVESFPQYPGNEAAYLRATIAIISTQAVLSPNGYYSVDEGGEQEDGTVKRLSIVGPADDFEAPEADALLTITGWTNHYPKVPPKDPAPEPPPEEEEGEEPAEEAEEEPFEDEPVTLDPMAEPEEDKPLQFLLSKTARFSDYAPLHVRSLKWPGATTVAQGKKHVNVYIGYGLPMNSASFTPPMPPIVCVEAPELHEQEELNEKVDFPPDAEGKGDAEAPPEDE